MNYRDEGDGNPLILISGFGGDCSFWKSSVSILSEDFRIISVDNRGVGETKYNGEFTLEDLAEDIACLMNHLDLDKADILGWSMGSHVAQWLAIKHPEMVKTLTIVSSYRYRPSRSKYVLSSIVESAKQGAPLQDLGTVINGFCLTEEFFRKKEENGTEIRLPSFTNVKGLEDQIRAIDKSDLSVKARHISAPTLAVHGTKDIMVEPEEGCAMADVIRDCKLYMVEGAGHLINIKQYMEPLMKHIGH